MTGYGQKGHRTRQFEGWVLKDQGGGARAPGASPCSSAYVAALVATATMVPTPLIIGRFSEWSNIHLAIHTFRGGPYVAILMYSLIL